MTHIKKTFIAIAFMSLILPLYAAEDPETQPPMGQVQQKSMEDFLDDLRMVWVDDQHSLFIQKTAMPLESFKPFILDAQKSLTDEDITAILKAVALSTKSVPSAESLTARLDHALRIFLADKENHHDDEPIFDFSTEVEFEDVFDERRALSLFKDFQYQVKEWLEGGESYKLSSSLDLQNLLEQYVLMLEKITILGVPQGQHQIHPLLNTMYDLLLLNEDHKNRLAFMASLPDYFPSDTKENLIYTLGLLSRIYTDAEALHLLASDQTQTVWAEDLMLWAYQFINNDLGFDAWDQIYQGILSYMKSELEQDPFTRFSTSMLQVALQDHKDWDEEDYVPKLLETLAPQPTHPAEDPLENDVFEEDLVGR